MLENIGNGIHRLSSDGFASMPLLKVILAGENALQNLEAKTFQGLNRLEVLDLHNNRLMSMHEQALRDLRRLAVLDLKGNRLDSLGSQMLKDNTALRRLDLGWNQLSNLPENSLMDNRDLEELILSHNALSELPPDLRHLHALKVLDLSYNRVQSVPSELHKMTSLTELNLSHNKLSSLNEGSFTNMPSLALLDIENNEIQFMAPHAIRALPNLTAVRLGHNRLTVLPSAAFSTLPSLLSAELQENQLTDIASDAFTAVPNLLMLNLSHNQLTGMERAGLAGLHSLEVLDLSHNRMTNFNSHNLPNLQALVHLKMDDNNLCNIYGSPFRKMSRLRVLSLRNNKMSSLSEETFKPLRHTMYALDIDGNPLQCSCSMMWLQTWMREAPYLSMEPRCQDGSLLRQIRMSHNDCSFVRYDEAPVPGCEAIGGLNSGYSSEIGPTQQLSSFADSKETTIRPLPQESEYFYEDFVEYEENTTLPFNMTQHSDVSGSYTTSSTTESSLQTIPPGVLSHFIPGDTPTLYAGTKSPPTTPPSPSVYTRQPSSAFTFFGMPLPSLGSFWGAGRDTDGRGRFTSNRGRGRVQQLPPVMQDGGFRPMLPHASGGFRPIFNPYNDSSSGSGSAMGSGSSSGEELNSHSQSLSHETLGPFNHSDWDNSLSLPHATVSRVPPPDKYKNPPGLEVLTSSEEEENHRPPSWDSNLSEALLESVGVGGGSEEISQRPPSPGPSAYPQPSTTPKEEMAFAISLPESTRPSNSTKINTMTASITIQDEKSNKSEATPTSITTSTTTGSFLSDLWGSVSYKGKGTPLSEFLAPGAQVPPSKPPGRPTITKVTVTPPLGPGPVPMAEDLQGPFPRLAKSPPQHYYTTQHQNIKNDSMAWYYSNYNKSELEPYVGPGVVGSRGPTKSHALIVSKSLLLLVLNLIVLNFTS